MKKCITWTLFCITISYISNAQGNAHPDITQISMPFKNLNDVPLFGKNFYFEKTWVKAKLLTADNSVISNDSFLFNFDKIDRRLLITTDFKRIFEIDRREFKAVLFYWHDSAYIFKHINFINEKDLFQVIVNDDNKYSLYKVVHTKLVKASYGGITNPTPGARDTYLDNMEYYIFFPNREYRTIHFLKRASIERVFKLNADSEKVDTFLNMDGDKEYEENDLIKLILYLNRGT